MPEEYDEEYLEFFPYQLMLEITALVTVAGILLTASWFPAELRPEYDPLNPPRHLTPEWYFMAIYQVLKTDGLGNPINGVLILTGIIVGLMILPFIDRFGPRHPLRRPKVATAGLILASMITVLTYLGFYVDPQDLKAWQLALVTLSMILTAVILVRFARLLTFRRSATAKRVDIE